MNATSAISTSLQQSAELPRSGGPAASERGLRATLGIAAPSPADPPSKNAAKARKLVGEFVGQTFYGVLLQQMQSSKLKGKYFHGGRGEEVFGEQLNMELAKRIGTAPNEPVTEHLYRALFERGKPKATSRGGQS